MSVKQVIALESEASIGGAIDIPFEFTDTSSIPEGETVGDMITITPIKVRTWFKLKPYLIAIEEMDYNLILAKESTEFSPEISAIMAKYDDLLFNIVAIGINNKKEDMPEWYKDVLKDNCTWHDIYILLNAILFRLNFNPFLNSIILVRSVSPLSEAEIIALQKNSETWSRNPTLCS